LYQLIPYFKADTVRKLCRKYKKTAITVRQKKGHRKQLLTDRQKKLICDWVHNHYDITEGIANKLFDLCRNEL